MSGVRWPLARCGVPVSNAVWSRVACVNARATAVDQIPWVISLNKNNKLLYKLADDSLIIQHRQSIDARWHIKSFAIGTFP